MLVTTKNGYTLALQIQPLRSNIATIHIILIMNVTLNVESFRVTFGSYKEIKVIPSIEWKIVRKVFCDITLIMASGK